MSGSRVEQIVEILSAYVGPHMARAAVDAHASRLGLDSERLDQGDLDRLADRIALGLKLFVGSDKADEVALAVRRVGTTGPEAAAGPQAAT